MSTEPSTKPSAPYSNPKNSFKDIDIELLGEEQPPSNKKDLNTPQLSFVYQDTIELRSFYTAPQNTGFYRKVSRVSAAKIEAKQDSQNEQDFAYYHDTRLLRKVSIDYELERRRRMSGKRVRFSKLNSIFVQEVKHWLDFDRRLNIPDQVVFHVFIWVYTLVALARFLVYEYSIFGPYARLKGLTIIYAQMWPTPGILGLYLWYPAAGVERTYVLIWLYKLLSIVLLCNVLAHFIDVFMFFFDRHMFCTLQTAHPVLSCEERNAGFMTYVFVFMLVLAPLWWGCNFAIYKLARQTNTANGQREFENYERALNKSYDFRNLFA